MQALLSFDRAPPFSAPLRFLATAPLFAAALGVLLVLRGEEVYASRWTPAALAATHLFTVGFLLQVMLGALVQILPVVAGVNVARPHLLARIVHGGLNLGAGALVLAFLAPHPGVYGVAAALLGSSIALFLAVAGRPLFVVPSTSPTIAGLKLAFVALAVAASLGILLLGALAAGWSLPLEALVDLHAGWGLGAWAGILLAAIAYVVVPMFQLTPGYPARPAWWFPRVLLFAMLVWSGAVALQAPALARFAEAVAAFGGMTFAAFTLHLQRRRRRAKSDATHRLWQLGLLSLFLGLLMLLVAALIPDLAALPGWPPLFAVLVGVGGYMSLVLGMLYKIVPFLAWLHVQNAAPGRSLPPISRYLPDRNAIRQTVAHAFSVVLLVAAAADPALGAPLAGMAVVVAALWLEFNLLTVLLRYRAYRLEFAPAAGEER